jgi:hypothetical protein
LPLFLPPPAFAPKLNDVDAFRVPALGRLPEPEKPFN